MLFNHGGTERDAGNRNAYTHGVVRQPHFTAEPLTQVRESQEIGVLRRSGIRAGTLEEDQVSAASVARRPDTLTQLAHRCHTG